MTKPWMCKTDHGPSGPCTICGCSSCGHIPQFGPTEREKELLAENSKLAAAAIKKPPYKSDLREALNKIVEHCWNGNSLFIAKTLEQHGLEPEPVSTLREQSDEL